jgi:hypothetical protein
MLLWIRAGAVQQSDSEPREAAPESAQVAETLAQVRAAVRREHAATATISADARRLVQRLEATRTLAEPVAHSHRAWLGRLVSVTRQTVYRVFTRWYLRPMLEQQNAFNRAVCDALREIVDAQAEPRSAAPGEPVAGERPADRA